MKSIKTIHELFSSVASQVPENTAIIDSATELTYSQLEQLSDEFYHFLKKQGVKHGDCIAISAADKSPQLIALILGILKSGGVYCIVDVSLPPKVKQSALDKLSPRLVVSSMPRCDSTNFNGLEFFSPNKEEISGNNDSNKVMHKHDLAYISLTSGTTGEPKAVAISHQNLLVTFKSWSTVYDLTAEDTHLQMADTAFDVFTGDWVRALCSGGSLVLCHKETLLRPRGLFSLITSKKITIAEFVPATLRALLDHVESEQETLSTFRMLICGSDLWTIREFKRACRMTNPDARVINSYGVTEATIDSTYFEVAEDELSAFEDDEIVPIGQPFPHVDIKILDKEGQAVSPGDIGEIYIGGGGVSDIGYLQQESLSAERFISLEGDNNSHHDAAIGHRYYRTGDQAVYTHGQMIQFLGRNETQTNVDGKRIDVVNIESILTQYPGISFALVLPKQQHERTLLTAFIVEDNAADEKIEFESMMSFLKDRLPAHSIPHEFYHMDKVPLTSRGKVDRTYPDTTSLQRMLPTSSHLFEGDLEQNIASLWQQVLPDLKLWDINASFDQVGGNSIEFTKIITQINDLYGSNIQPKDGFLSVSQIVERVVKHQHPKGRESVAVVGGGPAAISFCRQLIRRLIDEGKQNVDITVFEKSDSIGTGLPYGFQQDEFILNLPTEMMALGHNEQEQGSFKEWFDSRYGDEFETGYPPRYLFGKYVAEVASKLPFLADKHGITLRFETNREILDIEPDKGQHPYHLVSSQGHYYADYVVFCTGHMSSDNYREFMGNKGYIHNPWVMTDYQEIDKDEPVAVMGTRVSAIDVVMKLKSQGHRGEIALFSKGGLLPSVLSTSIPNLPLKYLTIDNLLTLRTPEGHIPLDDVIKVFWQEICAAEGRNIDPQQIVRSYKQQDAVSRLRENIHSAQSGPQPWQQVLFSSYPLVPTIWAHLSPQDQQRFMQEYNSLFLTYLAAFPLDNATKLLQYLESEAVKVCGGLQAVTHDGNGYVVSTDEGHVFQAPYLINATGPGYEIGHHHLLRSMKQLGLVVPHACGGIKVQQDSLRMQNSNGYFSSRLYAVGELTRGQFWATTDMYQANTQCSKVVDDLAKRIGLQPLQATIRAPTMSASMRSLRPLSPIAAPTVDRGLSARMLSSSTLLKGAKRNYTVSKFSATHTNLFSMSNIRPLANLMLKLR